MRPRIIYCEDCGKPRTTTCPTTTRCKACQEEADQQRIERWKDNIKKADRDFGGYYGKSTQCKCPRCGIIHVRRIDWTGNGVPRIYCRTCDKAMDVDGYAQEQEARFRVQI
jgi:hypothetical protein